MKKLFEVLCIALGSSVGIVSVAMAMNWKYLTDAQYLMGCLKAFVIFVPIAFGIALPAYLILTWGKNI